MNRLAILAETTNPLGLWRPRCQPRVWRDDDSDAPRFDERREAVEEQHGVWEAADEVGSENSVKHGQVLRQVAGITLIKSKGLHREADKLAVYENTVQQF